MHPIVCSRLFDAKFLNYYGFGLFLGRLAHCYNKRVFLKCLFVRLEFVEIDIFSILYELVIFKGVDNYSLAQIYALNLFVSYFI